MSVSSHLTPEPERRLWLILENTRRAVDVSDLKVAALTAFAAAELGYLTLVPLSGTFATAADGLLALALPFGLFAFSPIKGTPGFLSFLEPRGAKPGVDDNLVLSDDIAKYTHGELVHRLDKYLGGGITATQYYEDIVGQIVYFARVAARKQKLFALDCAFVGGAQCFLLAQLIWR